MTHDGQLSLDRFHALVPGTSVSVAGSGSGPLAGLSFAVKDAIDLAGYPDRRRQS